MVPLQPTAASSPSTPTSTREVDLLLRWGRRNQPRPEAAMSTDREKVWEAELEGAMSSAPLPAPPRRALQTVAAARSTSASPYAQTLPPNMSTRRTFSRQEHGHSTRREKPQWPGIISIKYRYTSKPRPCYSWCF